MKAAHKAMIGLGLMLLLSIADMVYSAPPKPAPKPVGILSMDCKDNAGEFAWTGISGTQGPMCFFIYRSDPSRLSVRTVPIVQP